MVEKSNTIIQSLKRKNLITEELKYFSNQYKKSNSFGEMYLLLKIHKRLDNVVDRLVI